MDDTIILGSEFNSNLFNIEKRYEEEFIKKYEYTYTLWHAYMYIIIFVQYKQIDLLPSTCKINQMEKNILYNFSQE
jgi:hypothetical protein